MSNLGFSSGLLANSGKAKISFIDNLKSYEPALLDITLVEFPNQVKDKETFGTETPFSSSHKMENSKYSSTPCVAIS